MALTTTTTASPTTTTTAAATSTPDPLTYVISATLQNEIFTDELLNRTSPRFQALSQMATGRCNQIYRARFGSDFDQCIVRQFRAAPAQQTRVDGTVVEFSVVFNRSIPNSALPMNTAVAQTLVDAANASNTFNVTFGASSVALVSGPVPDPTTAATTTAVNTIASTTAGMTTAATTTAVTPTAAMTIAATTTTIAAPTTTTASPTTTTAAPTTTTTAVQTTTTTAAATSTPDPVTYVISATLQNEIFTDELLNRTSPRFRELSGKVTARCNQIYRARFGSDFDQCIVRQFRAAPAQQTRVDGTVVEFSVVFNQSLPNSALPMNTAVAQTLVDAANDSNTFNVTFGASSVALISGPVPATTTAATTAVTTIATTTAAMTTAATTTAVTPTAATTTAVTTIAGTTNNTSFRSFNPWITLMLLMLAYVTLI
ncbi:mucin-5AC-like [Acanthopagrus latus]|uniref:mucin-5AC-like n=1 Tax=Acanthopagrus latus TaxID=8177 RepID=UPI00187CEBCB|nr:mucin-5AC-like [Acanthopagrus latus]